MARRGLSRQMHGSIYNRKPVINWLEPGLKSTACLVFEATVLKQSVRQEALRGLHYLFLSGQDMARGDFKAMLGMSDRSATDALGALVKRGLLKSDSPQGKVRFGLPQHALRFLFPQLWPEAEADSANIRWGNWPLAPV
jgi:hypothetical protein